MIEIIRANENHIEGIYSTELDSFSMPWSKEHLRRDMLENKLSIYIVALCDEEVVGYAGMWHVVTEGHITNLAVRSEYRGQGIGSMLVQKIIDISKTKEMHGITLECRISNTIAQQLYKKHGFKHEGLRKHYYTDTKEDAVIMWKHM